jgi:RNA-directed DNA polymerase
MNPVPRPMDGWHTIPWTRSQRHVLKPQKRLDRAARRGDAHTVRSRQRLVRHACSAKRLSVRRVTQDNRGKRTAGVDGVRGLPPPQRLALAQALRLDGTATPVRRVWMPKPGSATAPSPRGMPPMADRARHTLGQGAMEPAGEARFAPNSSGFRPGCSGHDARVALCTALGQQAKDVLDAASANCFDRRAQDTLLATVQPRPWLRRPLRAWLKAGVLDHGTLLPTETGTRQGSPRSP